MSYDARHPDAPHDVPAVGGMPHLTVGHLRPDLLHKVGETYAVALSRLQSQLAGTPDAAQVQAALAEVSRLERLGLQIQEIARVLAGEGRWVTERLDLGEAARKVASSWATAAQRRGVALHVQEGHAPAEVNAPVVEQLLELGLEYALHIGQRVELRAAVDGNPPQPALWFDIQRSARHRGADQANDIDDLQWLLFVTLARASGMSPQRLLLGERVQLRLAPVAEGVPAAPSPALLPTTPVAVGRRVLLVEPQETSRVQAEQLLGAAGMRVDVVARIDQAQGMLGTSLQTRVPDVLLTGVPAHDPACQSLIEALRAMQPRLRVVELVDDDSAFAFSVPGTDLPARVGRHTLPRTLVPALSQELDAV
jgi:hypothetical protein